MSNQSNTGGFARLADLALDGAAIGGVLAITHGVDLIYRPAAFIIGGLLLLAGAWLVARKGA